jgi:hypothetical protein
MDFASMSLYRWAASLVALVVFKFTVEKALLIRTAFARIKYVCSIYIVVSGILVPGKG